MYLLHLLVEIYIFRIITNPTSITHLNRESSMEEHVAIKDKEKLKNDKYTLKGAK